MDESQATAPERRSGPLQQRPRLGGDGQLWLPVACLVEGDGTVRIPGFHQVVDPFDPSAYELLLAESFARLALDDHQVVQGWFLYHGALDRTGFWDDPRAGAIEQPSGPVVDAAADIAIEQSRVRWLLATLASLSEHRLDGEWDPARDLPGPPAADVWADLEATVDRAPDITSSWEGTVELIRLAIAPYVAIAVERTFGIESEQRETAHGSRAVLVPWEWRVWRSILAPISLQLFESLRRITEGEPGAATCRECAEPFLVLDARRRLFCNERHRHRHNERRRRLARKRASASGRQDADDPR